MFDNAFFLASKLVWWAIKPETLLVFLAVLALFSGQIARLSRALLALLLLAIAILPLYAWIAGPLERTYPTNPDLQGAIGVIVLGGGERPSEAKAWQTPQTNEAGERFLGAITLAHQNPDLQVVFTGGSNRIFGPRDAEAEYAERLLGGAGIPPERLAVETTSRNTWENAVNTRAQLGDTADGPWILVTSAFHMRRAAETFCAAGWREIIPYPVDHMTYPGQPWTDWDLAENLYRINIASKEWIGLVAYRLVGQAEAAAPCVRRPAEN